MLSNIKNFIRMHLFDKKFRKDYKHYILQSLLIFTCICLALSLGRFFDDIIVASLGASSFILFITPHTNSSRPRYVIGGYICGSFSGTIFHFLYAFLSHSNFVGKEYVLIVLCAAAVAVAAFIMVITNTEHPPAAALALGLSADPRCLKTAMAAITSIIVLCMIKQLIKKHLKNLI